eukprot:15474481-Alexandrium_andersonii.AAC.1
MAEDACSPAARDACGPPAAGTHPREGKLASTRPGQHVTYVEDRARKYGAVGKVVTVVKAEEAVVLHRHRHAMDGRLRARWLPLYYATAEDGGQEQLDGV